MATLTILFIYFWREGRAGDRRNTDCERNNDLLHRFPTRDQPATQAYALTGNRTRELSLWGLTLNQLSMPVRARLQLEIPLWV